MSTSTTLEHLSFEEIFFNTIGTYIHKTAVIGSNVELGDNVKIGPNCILIGNVKIESGTKIFANVSIGFPAQDIGTKKSLGRIVIGENCNIREFVTIHAPKIETGSTSIGNNCYIMNFSHVAHDVTIENNVTLINNVNVAGHAHIESNVMLMANTGIHQFCKVGRLSCITPYSGTRQDIPPFSMFTGQPSHFSGLNLIALKRAGIASQNINFIKTVAKLYFQDKIPLAEIKNLASKEVWGSDKFVQEFLQFIEVSKRGVSRRAISYGVETYNSQEL